MSARVRGEGVDSAHPDSGPDWSRTTGTDVDAVEPTEADAVEPPVGRECNVGHAPDTGCADELSGA